MVKVIRNHGQSSRLPFTGVIECLDLRFHSPTCIVLLAPVRLLHDTFLPTSSPNSLFLGSLVSSHILLETAYDLVSDHAALPRGYYREGESFGMHRIPVVISSDDEEEEDQLVEDANSAE